MRVKNRKGRQGDGRYLCTRQRKPNEAEGGLLSNPSITTLASSFTWMVQSSFFFSLLLSFTVVTEQYMLRSQSIPLIFPRRQTPDHHKSERKHVLWKGERRIWEPSKKDKGRGRMDYPTYHWVIDPDHSQQGTCGAICHGVSKKGGRKDADMRWMRGM